MDETRQAAGHRPHYELQTTERNEPIGLAGTCHLLFNTMARLAAQKELLDADQVLSASDDDVAALLGAVRNPRLDCDDIASSIRVTQPATVLEAAAKNDALLAYSVMDGPDEFVLGTWPELLTEQPGSPHSAAPSTRTSLLRSWIRVVQARHAR